MTIGALIDAGADPNQLENELKKLKIADEYTLEWKKVVKNGITSTKFDVILRNDEAHHHHHGDHHHGHSHEEHSHHHDHTHQHRSYQDIVHRISESDLSQKSKELALKIFKKIGEAEGHIHGVSLEKVHFHEVGAVDSIIDIVGTAILIDLLGIEKVISSSIPVGSGRIHIDHGIYPVPAPATLEILRGIPIINSNVKAELVTPTGAAIIAVLAEEYGTFPTMNVEKIGYGAGTKTFPNHPNVLRVVIGT